MFSPPQSKKIYNSVPSLHQWSLLNDKTMSLKLLCGLWTHYTWLMWFCRSWTYSQSRMLRWIRAAATRLKCESLVRRAISVSSVYFSIALNSIIMRRRWLHYQRRVIGPFHQLLATHCANHRSASLTINRCDLVIKQGDGINMLMLLFLFILFFWSMQVLLGNELRCKYVLSVACVTIKCMQLYVSCLNR